MAVRIALLFALGVLAAAIVTVWVLAVIAVANSLT